MKIERIWAMPNKWTFKIKPIKELIDRYVGNGKGWIDPFSGNSNIAEHTNDLNPAMPSKSHRDAIDFCNDLEGYFEGALFDPPYSPTQAKLVYEGIGIKFEANDGNSNFYWRVKRAIAPKIKLGGYAITCGWNSNGFGKKLGFKIIEILLIAHGSSHNDTIVTVEKKIQSNLNFNLEKEIK